MSAVLNRTYDPARVPAPNDEAADFHRRLPGYAPTPIRPLDALADELGVAAVRVKDESSRLGLPSFKILGASWALERALRDRPDTHTVVAASAGNHGRAVARAAASRGLICRIFLPERVLAVRRGPIAAEGAEVVIVDGAYEATVQAASEAGESPGVMVIADVGDSGPPAWVIDGYQTLFSEAATQTTYDVILVPVGVGSLAAATARHAAVLGARVVGVEPATAACLAASLAAGAPTSVATPGTAMAGLDCAEVSPAAWPTLHYGITGTVVVTDEEATAAMAELARSGLQIGESGAAPLAGLRALAAEPACRALRAYVGLSRDTRVLLIATEGLTGNPYPASRTGR